MGKYSLIHALTDRELLIIKLLSAEASIYFLLFTAFLVFYYSRIFGN